MDNKPEDKKPDPGKSQPPRPPIGGKKPDLPGAKAPGMPMRPQSAGVPRPPLPGQKPGNSPLSPTPPMNRPPVPPAGSIGVPSAPSPRPPGAAFPPPGIPGMAKPPVMNPPAPPTPFEKGVVEVESAQNGLQDKIQELEKKLLEEREKVLMASLRSKEEEAVSTKVESSIKDIQDKLRRDRREQELDEAKKKAEVRLADIERRMSEEREAWVSTLKGQLNQRDQVTQEMESHFSSRLKDLEYRWSQEKSILEQGVRDREAEIIKIRQEYALKSEQEKAFWEDRIRVIVTDRDKYERELERVKEKFQQEKDLLQAERQTSRENISRLEMAAKFSDEQFRSERNALLRDFDSQKDIIERQKNDLAKKNESAQKELYEKSSSLDALKTQTFKLEHEKDYLEKEIATLKSSMEVRTRDLYEKTAQAESLKSQLATMQTHMAQYQTRILTDNQSDDTYRVQNAELQSQFEKLKAEYDMVFFQKKDLDRQLHDVDAQLKKTEIALSDAQQNLMEQEQQLFSQKKKTESEVENLSIELNKARMEQEKQLYAQKKKNESEVENLAIELNKARIEGHNELARIQHEADLRVKTLQARLDWYDSNANREYEQARDRVRVEMENLQLDVKTSHEKLAQLSGAEAEKNRISEQKDALKAELDNFREQWKQAQWDMETRVKELQDELQSVQAKYQHAEDERIALEQELKQRDSAHTYQQSIIEERVHEFDRMKDELSVLDKNYGTAKNRIATLERELEDHRAILKGQGLETSEAWKNKFAEVQHELEETRNTLRRLKETHANAEKAEEIFREKERVLKTLIDDKQNTIGEFKNRIQMLDRQLTDTAHDTETLKLQHKKMMDRLLLDKQSDFEQTLANERGKFDQALTNERGKWAKQHAEEVEQIRRQAAEETEQKIREAISARPEVDTQAVEAQVRQQMETEVMNQLRDHETQFEEKMRKTKEETKKEIDRFKWEAESLREDLKKAREARSQIEREAQDLLQQAEAHFKSELVKKSSELESKAQQRKGIFTSIGQFLDIPIIDTNRNKDKKKNDSVDPS